MNNMSQTRSIIETSVDADGVRIWRSRGTYLHVDRFGNNVVCKGDEGMRECTWIDANDERQLAIGL